MRSFLIKVALFLAIGFGYLLANYAVNWYVIVTKPLMTNPGHVLVLGDSHTKRSLNPAFMGSASNVSQLGEPYYVTYYKLRRVLDQTDQIDTVVLLFAWHSLSTAHDTKLKEAEWSDTMFNKFYMLPELLSIDGVPVAYASYGKTVLRRMCLYPSRRHNGLLGYYYNADENHLGNHDLVIARHFYEDGKLLRTSRVNIDYLWKIIRLCQERQIRPILLSTPVHRDYQQRVPPFFEQSYEALKEEFEEAGIEVWDKSRLPFDDREFFDTDHLNSRGAERFSRLVAERLANTKASVAALGEPDLTPVGVRRAESP